MCEKNHFNNLLFSSPTKDWKWGNNYLNTLPKNSAHEHRYIQITLVKHVSFMCNNHLPSKLVIIYFSRNSGGRSSSSLALASIKTKAKIHDSIFKWLLILLWWTLHRTLISLSDKQTFTHQISLVHFSGLNFETQTLFNVPITMMYYIL